ncbi:hypothetical protein IV203_027204 [Nitzschia inconspicua]|uniref:Uncharacterized protein n=1 Tax=Nitzschia inconspicua TaxID=303405 RepID=A0A9K3LVU5_9STRA|nr:hypothetical protein IV203_027204 [Nitzschia inconspicua]
MPTHQRFSLFSLLTYLTVASLVRLGWMEKEPVVTYVDYSNDAPSLLRIQRDINNNSDKTEQSSIHGSKQSFTINDQTRERSVKNIKGQKRQGRQRKSLRHLNPSIWIKDERKWLTRSIQSNTRQSTKYAPTSTLIIATFPSDIYHLMALWTQLECFAVEIDTVIISAPVKAKVILEDFVLLATSRIPHFINGSVQLEIQYHEADERFETGLWCHALNYQSSDSKHYNKDNKYGLLHDSLFALEPYSGIWDELDDIHTADGVASHNKGYTPQPLVTSLLQHTMTTHNVLDSNFRGFNQPAMDLFRKHICRRVPKQQQKQQSHRQQKQSWLDCHGDGNDKTSKVGQSQRDSQLCVKRHFEVEWSRVLDQNNVGCTGLWPHTEYSQTHFFGHEPDNFAEYLVEQEGFPALLRSTILRRQSRYVDGDTAAATVEWGQCAQYIVSQAELEAVLEQ